MSPTFISRWRLGTIAFFVISAFIVVLGRLFFLHVWEGDNLRKIVEDNREKFEVRPARRGNIVDARGNLLAGTRAVVELGVDPQVFSSTDTDKLEALARIINMPLGEIKLRVLEKTALPEDGYHREVRLIRWRKLADGLDEATYAKIKELDISGVYGNLEYERYYPGGQLGAHALGFVNKENTSVCGLEYSMDFYLRGQDGWYETERDGRRRELAQFRSRQVNATDGLNIELTLDLVVQDIIEEELNGLVSKFAPVSATAIVSDPSTGFLLGLANVPTFDLNSFWRFPVNRHRNRAVTDQYEPGSTFKIVAVSGAIESGVVEPGTILDCGRTTATYRGRLLGLPGDHRPFGPLSVHEILCKSSNRGAAQLGILLGGHRLHRFAETFGFGSITGFETRGEVSGVLHKVRDWDSLTISRLPVGYAVSATPLQVHFAVSVIANQGVLMTPCLVRRVFDEAGETVIGFSPRPKHRAVSVETAERSLLFEREIVEISESDVEHDKKILVP